MRFVVVACHDLASHFLVPARSPSGPYRVQSEGINIPCSGKGACKKMRSKPAAAAIVGIFERFSVFGREQLQPFHEAVNFYV